MDLVDKYGQIKQRFIYRGRILTKNSKNKHDFMKRLANCFELQNCSKFNGYFKMKINCYINNLCSRDVDNISKIVLDALNGVAYEDDKYCCGVNCNKNRTLGEEYIEIEISTVIFVRERTEGDAYVELR